MKNVNFEYAAIEKAISQQTDASGKPIDVAGQCVMAQLAAYVAILAAEHEAGASLAEILEDEDDASREFLLAAFDESWLGVALALSSRFTKEELGGFALAYGTYVDERSSRAGASACGTPACVSDLALALLDVSAGDSLADLGCGRGDFLARVAVAHPEAALGGLELCEPLVCLARVRLRLLGRDSDIRVGDMLSGADTRTFDRVFSNYPFGLRCKDVSGEGAYYEACRSGRGGYGHPMSLDWVFNQAIYDSLAPGGRAVAVMLSATTCNGSDKGARKHFVEGGMVQAVVALPAGLFPYTGLSTVLIVLGRNDGLIRLVDAADLASKGRRRNIMEDADIAEALQRYAGEGDHSRLVPRQEIAANDYSLLPAQYLGRQIELVNATPLGDLAVSIGRGAMLKASELDALATDEDTGSCYLRLSDIADGSIGTDLPRIREIDPKLEKHCLRTGDLLISKNGAPFRVAVAEVAEDQAILANGNLYIIRLDTARIDPYFVAAFLASEDGGELFARATVGTAIPNLPLRNLRGIQVPVPDMQTQRAVANRYKERLAEIGDLKRRLQALRESASSTYGEMMGR